MRWLSDILRFGTEQYPEKVARRLRAVNIAALMTAASSSFFAVQRLLIGPPGQWRYPAIATFVILAIPLLHRFGPLAAPLALLGFGYVWLFLLSATVGTDGGTFFFYLTVAAGGVLLVGAERILLSIAICVMAVGLIILMHIVVPRNTGLVSTEQLYVTFIANLISSSAVLYGIVFYVVRQLMHAETAVEREHQRSEALLTNILPTRIAERLKENASAEIADAYPEASILFADMAGFTARASDTSPVDVVHFLNSVYTKIDNLVERRGLEKIKTTGDAYMVVSGVPEPRSNHAEVLADLALDIRDALAGLVDQKGREVPMRIGIATGPVVAGVVGTRKFFYDVWGDAVNTASRMESTGVSGCIQVSEEIYARLKDKFELESRGPVEIKGKGTLLTWFLLSRKR